MIKNSIRKHKSTPYQRGRAFEYRVRNHLLGRGYYVMRAYGSKGQFDLIAVPPVGILAPRTLLIQCKTNGYVPPKERSALVEASKKYSASVVVISRDKKNKLVWRYVQKD